MELEFSDFVSMPSSDDYYEDGHLEEGPTAYVETTSSGCFDDDHYFALPKLQPGPRYHVLKYLGSGTYGTVFECIDLHTQKLVAIKRQLTTCRYESNESRAFRNFEHQNLIEAPEVFFSTDKYGLNFWQNIVMTHMDTSLYYFFGEGTGTPPIPFTRVDAHRLIKNMLEGMSHIHKMGFIHRDLKPCNMLVDNKTKTLKICDFGTTISIFPDREHLPYICSRFYRAPELLMGWTRFLTLHAIFPAAAPTPQEGEVDTPGDSEPYQLKWICDMIGSPQPSEMQSIQRCLTGIPRRVAKDTLEYFHNKPVQAVDFVELLAPMISVLDLPIYDLAASLLLWDPSMRPNCEELLSDPWLVNDCNAYSKAYYDFVYHNQLPNESKKLLVDIGIIHPDGSFTYQASRIARYEIDRERLNEIMGYPLDDCIMLGHPTYEEEPVFDDGQGYCWNPQTGWTAVNYSQEMCYHDPHAEQQQGYVNDWEAWRAYNNWQQYNTQQDYYGGINNGHSNARQRVAPASAPGQQKNPDWNMQSSQGVH